MADHGLRVLVVDDTPVAADPLLRWAFRQGHWALAAHTAPAALAAARDLEPDVVLVEVGLAGLDGYELARQLRAEPTLAGVTLVAVTGDTGLEHRRRAEGAGFDHYLVKPVGPAELGDLLRVLTWEKGKVLPPGS
jgi:CheY-like chemotaxis protein